MGENGICNNYYNDLNDIHGAEIKYLNILTEEQHWLQITESMGFNKGINIGHWPAEATERADAFLLTMYKIKNQTMEFARSKSKEYQNLYERLQYILP